MALPATDSFTASSGPLANPPWTTPSVHSLQYDGSGNCDVSASGDDETAIWNADSFGADQYSEVTVHIPGSVSGLNFVTVMVRSDGGPLTSGNAYMGYSDASTSFGIVKLSAGSQSTIASAFVGPAADGFTLRLDVVGSVLTLSFNGTDICSATDTDFTSGQPGIDLYCPDGPGVLQIASWIADASSAPPPPGTHVVSGRGSFSVTSPAWLSTSIAGRPSQLGNGPAEPPNWLHMGSLSWGTSHGVMNRYIVTRDLDLVNLPSGMTEVHYEFANGITATIVELSSP